MRKAIINHHTKETKLKRFHINKNMQVFQKRKTVNNPRISKCFAINSKKENDSIFHKINIFNVASNDK
jgi:hypothetical protein